MGEQVSIELSTSDWQTVLTIIKVAVREEENSESTDSDFVKEIRLLYDNIEKQLMAEVGEGHIHGLYEDMEE